VTISRRNGRFVVTVTVYVTAVDTFEQATAVEAVVRHALVPLRRDLRVIYGDHRGNKPNRGHFSRGTATVKCARMAMLKRSKPKHPGKQDRRVVPQMIEYVNECAALARDEA